MAHRYRLCPDAERAELARHCADARYVWNLALEQANCYRPGRPHRRRERFRQLAEARKGSWLGQGSSSVQQQALRDFDQALRNWWAGDASPPTVAQGRHRRGVLRPQRQGAAPEPEVGDGLVAKLGRSASGCPAATRRAGMARITMDRAGRWHVSFTAPQPIGGRQPTGRVVGLDAGVVATLTTSEASTSTPRPAQNREQLACAASNANWPASKKASNRRARTKAAIARLKATEADRGGTSSSRPPPAWSTGLRPDRRRGPQGQAHGPLGRRHPRAPGTNVAAKRGLNRAISAQGWSTLRRRLTDKAATCEVNVVAVNPAQRLSVAPPALTPAPTTARAKRCSGAGPAGTRPTPTSTPPSTSSPPGWRSQRRDTRSRARQTRTHRSPHEHRESHDSVGRT